MSLLRPRDDLERSRQIKACEWIHCSTKGKVKAHIYKVEAQQTVNDVQTVSKSLSETMSKHLSKHITNGEK